MMEMMGRSRGDDESGGGMVGMMSEMMSGGHGRGMPMMPQMMTQMMPHCLPIMLPHISPEERTDFVLNMITVLMEHGSAGMSEEEKNEFVAKVLERVTS